MSDEQLAAKRLALSEMQDIVSATDFEPEKGHMRADAILCELLVALGYDDIVEEFKKVVKWYA